MMHFSALKLLKEGFSGQRGWHAQWRSAEPKPSYDAVIVGGGGHGLGAAYYLASGHRLTNVGGREGGGVGGGGPRVAPPFYPGSEHGSTKVGGVGGVGIGGGKPGRKPTKNPPNFFFEGG